MQKTYLIVSVVIKFELFHEEFLYSYGRLTRIVLDLGNDFWDLTLHEIRRSIRKVVGTCHGSIRQTKHLLKRFLKMKDTYPVQLVSSAFRKTSGSGGANAVEITAV